MGKTLTGILEIGAAIGLQFVPGLGTVAGITLGASLGVAGLTTLLTTTPKPSLEEIPKKSPTPVRRSGYGRGRMQPTWALYEVAPNGWACDAYAFHDGRINRIIDTYVGDKRVSLLPGGWVQELDGGAFKGNNNCQIETRMGLPTETAFGSLIFNIPDHWTANHRGDGVVTGSMISKNVKSKNWQGVYSLGGPNQAPLSLSMERQLVYDWRDPAQSVTDPETWKYSENFVLHLAHYLLIRKDTSPPRLSSSMDSTAIAAARAAYWNRVGAVWALKFAPTLASWTTAANDADLPVPLKGVQTLLASKADDGATSVNLLSVNGLHAGMSIAIAISGDTSKTETRTVTSVSGTVVHFSGGGLSYTHPLGSQVTWSSDPANPATEPRYRGCVTHSHNEAHKDVINRILLCGDGYLTTRYDGAYVVYSGRYTAPTVNVGPRDIISWSVQHGVNGEDAVNTLKVTYISDNHDFSAVDTDDWVDEDDIEARGKELSDSFQAETPSFSQNRRLAKRVMAKRMAPYRGTVVISGRRRDVQSQRYIALDLTEAGETFFSGPVELSNGKRLISTGSYQYDFVAIDPNIDAWNAATEEGNPAPVGNRVATQPVDAPTIISAIPDFSAVSDGGTGVRIDVTVAGINRDDVTWFARWRVQGASAWNEDQYSDIDPGASVQIVTGFVPTGSVIEIEAAQQTGDGRLSDYSSPSTLVNTATDQTAPDAATAISVVSWVDALNLSTDIIARATSYRWRFYASDGTTLIRTIVTAARTVSYTAAQAVTDGVLRSYVVTVAGVNAAGAGTEASSGVITNAPPSLVTGFSATGGASNAEIDFTLLTEPDVAGYAIYVSSASGFDPLTQGSVFKSLGSPAYLQNLAAGTFYVKMAAYDAWSDYPGFLNITSEDSFAITTGGGGTGGGGGGGGGGYCVTIETPILMADGSTKPAGDLVVGDMLRTQHEATMAWGDYPVEAIAIVDSSDVWRADIGPDGLSATGEHRVWISGWVHMRDIGTKAADGKVAKITVTGAHTYVSAGVLSHNIKRDPPIDPP